MLSHDYRYLGKVKGCKAREIKKWNVLLLIYLFIENHEQCAMSFKSGYGIQTLILLFLFQHINKRQQ